MIPDMVSLATGASSNLQIGTVIDFPGGNSTVADKLRLRRQFRMERRFGLCL
jgi:deoxyribose-phosphate aldolase